MSHSGAVSEWMLVSQAVGYTVSTVIVLLLALLVRRAARFDEASAYGLLLWSVLLWNAGNLLITAGALLGFSAEAGAMRVVSMAAFSGAAMAPAGALTMWQSVSGRSRLVTWLVRLSLTFGVAIAALVWIICFSTGSTLAGSGLKPLLAYHVAVFVALGAWVFTRDRRTSGAARLGIGMVGLGGLAVGAIVLLEKGLPGIGPLVTGGPAFEVGLQMATHVMTLGALFFFARFRFADVFIRQSLRMIAAVLIGMACAALFVRAAAAIATLPEPYNTAVALAGGTLFLAALILSFAHVDRLIVGFVDRWLFRQPDYDAALTRLRDELAVHRDPAALHAATVSFVRDLMAVQDVRVVPEATLERVPHVLTVPLDASEDAGDVLEVTPRWDHPTLLDREVAFLRASAALLGHRVETVRREHEELDARMREIDLRRQVSEATLRALQAQVNPHFLFNTLNTIAQLIQEDPAGAEAMTVRLADVFSHVLTGGHRPFSSVREEMDFLRTYLTIEEARFGERLQVAFAVQPAAARAVIPSLILQPAVENALKHGLSRKIGPGHLTISAIVDGVDLQLSVEDDGVGPAQAMAQVTAGNGHRRRTSGGMGLRNIAERLETLYADRASMRFVAAPRGGSVLTVRLPLHAHDQEPAG